MMNEETSIIGQLLQSDKCKSYLPKIDKNWFTGWHINLIGILQEMYINNEMIGLITVSKHLKELKLPKERIYDFATYFNSYQNDRYFEAEIINLEYAYKKKRLIEQVTTITSDMKLTDLINFLSIATQEAQITVSKPIQTINQLTGKVIDDFESAIKRGDYNRGIDTGFKYLNKYIGGYNKGNLIIIGGRPGSGKTALALCMCKKVSEWAKCLFISLEMSSEEISKRYISLFASVENYKLRNGNLSLEVISDISNKLYKCNNDFYICDDVNLTINEIKAKCKIHKAKYGLDIVFIDYLQLIYGTKKSRLEEISEISRMLKSLAKELEITIVALAQLSRQSEQRQDKRPLLSDLRESGQIEQDADIILFPFRPAYYEQEKPEIEMDAELIIAKNRHGQCITIPMSFEGRFTKYEEIL